MPWVFVLLVVLHKKHGPAPVGEAVSANDVLRRASHYGHSVFGMAKKRLKKKPLVKLNVLLFSLLIVMLLSALWEALSPIVSQYSALMC